MGQLDVAEIDQKELRVFTRRVLDDLQALEQMLDQGAFERDVRRIGAEQEMFLVDAGQQPAPKAMEVLGELAGEPFTTELAKFNLEANLPPYVFGTDCLRRMEADLDRLLASARAGAAKHQADVLLAGILPTLKLSDLGLDNMAPVPRYFALNNAILRLTRGPFRVKLKGTDELDITHDNVMLESCNTSFQLHFQVAADEFVKLYNAAQAITGPVLAAAVNSPILLEKRLWQETRIALFQHSVDDRTGAQLARGRQARVRFGSDWLHASVLEIFRDDIARFRVLLGTDVEEDPLAILRAGGVPQLAALRLHNGTVYRWNRPCYGIHEGKPHLRIENRVLPAGPTVLDEVANAAFFFGLMAAFTDEYGDMARVMPFDDAKANFVAAARLGLKAQFTWVGGATSTAAELILKQLLPLARSGLAARGIDSSDVDRYLGTLEERVLSGQTGAQWALSSIAGMPRDRSTPHARLCWLTAGMRARQWTGQPVHRWTLAGQDATEDWRSGYRTVGQFMLQDIYTVQPDDPVDLVVNMMDWVKIRNIPVEYPDGRFAGMVDLRQVLRMLARGRPDREVTVRDIMETTPETAAPSTPTVEALATMRDHDLGCLPVVQGEMLVGLVTKRALLDLTIRLIDGQLRAQD
ncbi:MAG: CBS domain-containing protein [Myxococcales bacterium]|nr:CBS domain-containing protein [Myxococcales bacterium]